MSLDSHGNNIKGGAKSHCSCSFDDGRNILNSSLVDCFFIIFSACMLKLKVYIFVRRYKFKVYLYLWHMLVFIVCLCEYEVCRVTVIYFNTYSKQLRADKLEKM